MNWKFVETLMAVVFILATLLFISTAIVLESTFMGVLSGIAFVVTVSFISHCITKE